MDAFNSQVQPITPDPLELIFVDQEITNYQGLVNGLNSNAQLLQLDLNQDGIAQITNTLQQYQNIGAIHVFSLGSPGSIQLGNIQLNLDNLNGFSDELQSWNNALTADADILFYGCNVAETEEGTALLQQISQLTGSDIAASTDKTGSAVLGGDWTLEATTGIIEASTLVVESYDGVLDTLIPPAQIQTLRQGLQAVADFADKLDNFGDLARIIPFVGEKLGTLLDAGELLRSQVVNPINNFINNAANLTTNDLLTFIQGLANVAGVNLVVDGNKITYSLTYNPTVTKTVNLDLAQFGLDADDQADFDINANLNLNFAFGVDLTSGLAPAEAFFIQVNDLSATAALGVDFATDSLNANLGILAVGITDGNLDLTANVDVTFNDPDGNGDITVSELQNTTVDALIDTNATGTLNGALQLAVSSSFFPVPGNPTLTVSDSNIFDSTAPDVQTTDLEDLLNFKNLTPGDFVGLLSQLGNTLQTLSSSLNPQGGIPFIDNAISEVIDLAEAIEAKVRGLYDSVLAGLSQYTGAIASVANGIISQAAAFEVAVNNAVPVAVSLAAGNYTNRAGLRDAINTALSNAGLGSLVQAILDGDRIVFKTLNTADSLAIKFAADSIGMKELGFESSLSTGSLFKFENIQQLIPLLQQLLGSNPNFQYDANTNILSFDFNFTRNFEEGVEFDFNREFDLGIGTLAISGGAEGELDAGVTLTLSLGIDLSPIGGSFTLSPSTQLSSLPQPVTINANSAIQIVLSDSNISPILVDLSSATTIGDVIDLITDATYQVEVTIDTERDALRFKDISGGTDRPFAILTANNSQAGAQLGILGVDLDQDEIIEGAPLHGDSLLERLFIEESSSVAANVSLTASDIDLAAAISILEVGIENGNANIQVGTQITLNDPGSDGRITLQEFLDNPITSIVNINSPTASGSIVLPISLSGLEDLGIDLPNIPTINLGFSANSPIVVTPSVTDLDLQSIIQAFTDFSTDDLLNVLGRIVDLLNTQQLGIFNQKIPLVDKSINELLEFTKPFTDAISSIVGSVEELRETLLAAINTPTTGILAIIQSVDFLDELSPEQQDKLFHALERLTDVINDLPQDINGLSFKVPGLLVSAINGLGDILDEIEAEVTGGDAAFTGKLNDLQEKFKDVLQAIPSVQKAVDFILGEILDAVGLANDIFTTVDAVKATLETRINALIAEIPSPTAAQQTVLNKLEDAKDILDQAIDLESLSTLVKAFEQISDAIADAQAIFTDAAQADNITDLLTVLGDFTELLPVRFGLKFNPDQVLGFSFDIDLENFVDLSHTVPLNFNLEDDILGVLPIAFQTSGELTFEFGGSVNLDFVLDLNPPSVAEAIYILDSTQIQLTAFAELPDFNAELTIGGVSGISIENGFIRFTDATDITKEASLTIALVDNNSDGKILLTDLLNLNTYNLTANGKIDVSFPVKFLSNDIGNITATLNDITDFADFEFNIPPDFFDNLFDFGDFDLLGIIQGIQSFFTLLENGLKSQALSALPIIGDELNFAGTKIGQLNAAFEQFFAPLRQELENLSNGSTADQIKALIQQEIFDILGTQLGIIDDLNGDGSITVQDIEITLDNDSDPSNTVDLLDPNIELLIRAKFGYSEIFTSTFDLGFDGLGLIGASIQGGVQIALGASFEVGFGLNKKQGAFIELNDNQDPEIDFTLDISLIPDPAQPNEEFNLTGNLFFLGVKATNQDSDGDGKKTGINGEFTIDLADGDGTADNRIGLLDILDIEIDPRFAASVEIDFLLEANLENNPNLPSIKADLLIDWVLDDSLSLSNQAAPNFSLSNARLDLGGFISRSIGPIVEKVDEYLEPIRPILDVLNKEIPVISQLSELLGQGKVTFVDAIRLLGEGGDTIARVVDILTAISDFVSDAAAFNGKNLEISLGSLLNITSDIRNGAPINIGSGTLDDTISSVEDALNQISNQADQQQTENFFNFATSTSGSGLGIAFPIFTDPSNIFKLLLGQTADLITWDIPRLEASFSFSQLFGPVLPPIPIFARISGQLAVFADFFVGLDTRGLQTGNFLDGFFFLDKINGEDVPELGLTAEFSAGAELNIVVASAGVRGGIRAGVFANWNDPNADGKLYFDELLDNLERGLECIFDLEGALKAFFEAFVKIGFDTPFGFVTIFKKSFTLASITLLDFSSSCPPLPPPVLGHVTNGTLILHTGANAGLRQPGFSTDTDETLQVRQLENGDIEVKGFGETQIFSGVTAILWDGGAGNDVLNLDASVTMSTTLTGGDGDDEIIGGSGVDNIDGGAGNDQITAGAGDDVIHGGVGNDVIFGNAGADQIFGDEDDDTISGGNGDRTNEGDAADTIDGGSGSDKIAGNLGNDVIKGGDGNDDIEGNEGNDFLEGGADTDLIAGGAGDDQIHGGAGNDILRGEGDNVKAGTGGNDKIFGGGGIDDIQALEGNNEIYGDGEDSPGVATATADEGDDTIVTGNGTDKIFGGGGNDTITAGGGNDYIEGGQGSDQINAGAGDDTAIGGSATANASDSDGNDTILGEDGNDLILGDNAKLGSVILIGGAGNDSLFGGAGNDTIYGQGGDDLIEGSTGEDQLFGGTGDDILRGQEDKDYIEGGADDDEISGGTGDDAIIGGVSDLSQLDGQLDGSDQITGDSGNDVVLGDNGTITLTNGIVTAATTNAAGGAGSDSIFGGVGNDIIFGGGLGDQLVGDAANATGDDIIIGDQGNLNASEIVAQTSNVAGSSGDDTISGSGGNDIALGGDGNDNITGDRGFDILVGDNGIVSRTNGIVTRIATSDPSNGGNDTITGGDDDDVALGGTGDDSITGGDDAGADILLGDNGTVVRNDGSNEANDIFSTFAANGGVDTITGGAGSDIIIGGTAGDNLQGNAGDDVIVGDHGTVQRNAADVVERITTTFENIGGNDNIAGNDGTDIALGGIGDDSITGDAGADILLGDNGRVIRNDGSSEANDIISQSPEFGGVDNIIGDIGDDIIIGGTAGDNLQGNAGDDVIVGDHGTVQRNAADIVERITTTFESNGGNDNIAGNDGADIGLGGIGNDIITGDAGADILLGDNGRVIRNDGSSEANDIISQSPEFGGVDTITGGTENDTIIGGGSGDQLTGNAGDDVVIGDHATIKRNSTDTIETIQTTFPDQGGNDNIAGNEGNDILIGGFGQDIIDGAVGNDIALGDNGYLDYTLDSNLSTLDLVTTTNPTLGDSDNIVGGEGNDLIFGGTLGDNITAGAGNDLVFGDHGKAQGNIDLTALPLNQVTPPFTFTAIDTQQADLGGNETISGGDGDDIILGQQGNDRLFGDAGDDDLIGGHNVAGGFDGNDEIDGGIDNDVIAGDNASVLRRADTLSPRIRVLSGTIIYDSNGQPQVTANGQLNPTGAAERNIELFDHAVNATAGTFGNDLIAGGADDDLIFGQLGNDVIQGDSSTAEVVSATNPSVEAATDGDDYIEGGGGDDLIFGNSGQDDIIGGSSSLFGNTTASERPDGKDIIFGGAGTRIARNDLGDTSNEGHARDADVIVGDNANIFRLVGINGVSQGQFLNFTYDNYSNNLKIIPRAIELLDYTAGDNPGDIGNDDLIHGEAGDDIIHGMTGNDVLFGEGQDDDIYGGDGSDRIYGGAGEDGIIGDNGQIFTSRNGLTETLYGLTTPNLETNISVPGPFTGAWIYISGRLNKTVDLAAWESGGNDTIYGGLGDDFIHGGAGDDGISGAEAQANFYNSNPVNTNPLNYNPVTRKFAAYDANNALKRIDGFFLNFDATNALGKINDGKDRLFGDLGNDWLVGGTQNDRLFGGFGDDLMNADDNHDTASGLNNQTDTTEFADRDFAFGGAGLDVLIGNTGGDRLIDWVGEFNSYWVPFNPFGEPTVIRSHSPHIQQFLLDLGRESGADQTRQEPNAELGLVTPQDPQWQDQNGAPRDPQAGNTRGRRDTQGAPEDDRGTALPLSSGSNFAPIISASIANTEDVTVSKVANVVKVYVDEDTSSPNQNVLYIGGTNGNDIIEVRRGSTSSTISVFVNGKQQNEFSRNNLSKVIIYGNDGNDTITINADVDPITAIIYGGFGDDTIRGGLGNNIIDGGDGKDQIIGGDGVDLLIGSQGADSIEAKKGDDILISGGYRYSESLDALASLLNAWLQPISYSQRVTNLKNGTGFNSFYALNTANLIDDKSVDSIYVNSLTGEQGFDWFLISAGDKTDEKGIETSN